MVCTYTHGDVDIILLLCNRSFFLFLESDIFQTGNSLLCLDDWLEDIGVVV